MTPDGTPVASVTTILSKTKPYEDMKALMDWRKRVGEKEAQQITEAAANRGTKMHSYLEEFCLTDAIAPPIKKEMKPSEYIASSRGFQMAHEVIDNSLSRLDECWAVEASLYFPELYAGTTDCVGVFDGKESIIDFKQTNKPKKRSWIDDYFLQLTAYGEAHNEMFGTNIKRGVVLMCSKDLNFQEFILEGDEWDAYMHKWFDRVAEYYEAS